jgi:hypothetical protein
LRKKRVLVAAAHGANTQKSQIINNATDGSGSCGTQERGDSDQYSWLRPSSSPPNAGSLVPAALGTRTEWMLGITPPPNRYSRGTRESQHPHTTTTTG